MDCDANSDVSAPLTRPPPPSADLCVAHSHLSAQELLCYLIDDGGFLIMSNQKEDWDKVRTMSPQGPGSFCGINRCPRHTGGDVLQRRGALPDVRPLQQLLLQGEAVVRLPVRVRAAAQQRGGSGAQGSVCGETERNRRGPQGSTASAVLTCGFSPQPTIADLVNLAWWTSAAAW